MLLGRVVSRQDLRGRRNLSKESSLCYELIKSAAMLGTVKVFETAPRVANDDRRIPHLKFYKLKHHLSMLILFTPAWIYDSQCSHLPQVCLTFQNKSWGRPFRGMAMS